MIRKLLGRVASEVLYTLGDLVSRIPYSDNETLANAHYAVYNSLMVWSSDIQDWSGNNRPWH
jgi:hypothetical protein